MGPTNIALVQLFQADQQLREAQERLDSATRRVRIQERRVKNLTEELKLTRTRHREHQMRADELELDIKTRDAQIEKLRTQQQNTRSNKEYQTFLLEINTRKIDRNKVEEEAIKTLEAVEQDQKQIDELAAQLEQEQTKLTAMNDEISDRIAALQAEIDQLQPVRDQAAAAVPGPLLDTFERLADRFDGEAMASIAKPNPRREEYVCNACNMSLVVDAYNRLHVRDEPVFCPSCGRLLYIPDDLPPEMAVNRKKTAKSADATGS